MKAATLIRLQDYRALVRIESPQFSPDSKEIAFLTVRSNLSNWGGHDYCVKHWYLHSNAAFNGWSSILVGTSHSQLCRDCTPYFSIGLSYSLSTSSRT